MSRRRVRLVVVCEDAEHRSFLHGLLVDDMGFETRKIRWEVSPSAEGAAEQWVRERHAKEVAEVRRRRERIAMLTMIDADGWTVGDRHDQLDASLTEAKLVRRDRDEPISIQVPRRNVGTWVRYLEGAAVDEESDYEKPKKLGCERCRTGGARMRVATGNQRDDPMPPSLDRGRREMERLELASEG